MMYKILHHIWVKSFYERHSGMLFFIFFIMFGMVESSQVIYYHISLMHGAITSPIFFTLIVGIWALYSLKVIHFCRSQRGLEQNEVLMEFGKLSPGKTFQVTLAALIVLDLPVLLYSACIVAVALSNQYLIEAALIVIIHVGRLSLGAAWMNRQLHNVHREWILPKLNWRINLIKPSFLFLVTHLLDRLKTVSFITKVFSMLCIIGMLQIDTDGYDIRLPLLGITAGFAAHAVIVFEFMKLESIYLDIQRTLPISLSKRLFTILASYAVLLIPEFILLLVNHVPLMHGIAIVLFCTCLLGYLHTALYRGLDMDAHIRRTLIAFLLSFLAIISKIFLAALLISLMLSWYKLIKNYYRYKAEIS